MTIPAALRALTGRWRNADAAERANAQLYLTELCDALDVERPRPAGSGYQFELPIKVISRDGRESTNFVDLYKHACFLLEAKDQEAGKPDEILLRKAFGQARTYAAAVEGNPPPYLLVLDIGKTLLIWDRWSGSYGGFNAGRRIDLRSLADRPEDIELLRDIWTHPEARDPRARAVAVTEEIAERLAELAGALESRGHDQESVARFLIRCVFTMFAEDMELLPDEPFRVAIEQIGLADPDEFGAAIEELWRAMDAGRRFGLRKLLRFNGHFFADAKALPLTKQDLQVLLQAARADWRYVEPSIFGTLLTRALDREERHRLGAEYTPRAYVERVVRPTVEEPVRERWGAVQAEVLERRDPTGKGARKRKTDEKAALAHLREFHAWLRGLRFLDPACGSGNFLYVTLASVKRVELEVLREIEAITGNPELAVEEVGPWQFHGLEIKPWARELAELSLWIGYFQFWREAHGHAQPPEPVLRDVGTLEQRDAVLAWDGTMRVPERDRPDPTPRIPDLITGKLVPDPAARLEYEQYIGARPADWPRADFIIGNPPYMGTKRMRDAFGDGYVDAIRSAYPELPESADYVMYWWYHAAREVAEGRTIRAGLITTNTITQQQNRPVLERAAEAGARVVWAVANHPWVVGSDGAAVRVAMTVISREPTQATLVEMDDTAAVVREVTTEALNLDLSAHADVASAAAVPLLSNKGLAAFGFALYGSGFILEADEAEELLRMEPQHQGIIKPYRNGKDITARPRGVYVIDFGYLEEGDARQCPVLFDLVRTRVKPARDANARATIRDYWWRFGWPRRELREALSGLARYIVTPETAKHRFFTFLDTSIAPDHKLVCIASDDAFHLGVLSASIHVAWALAAGGRLGVGNDPVYNKSVCFDPFPFPAASSESRQSIAALAERVDAHRKNALARDEKVTMTGMYNVIAKLRAGEPLTPSERTIHDLAACGVLRDLHDELDRQVADAYGWPWPLPNEAVLDRLVQLHNARAAEEETGEIRWLRPAYQRPRFRPAGVVGEAPKLSLPAHGDEASRPEPKRGWPTHAVEQLVALQALLARSPHSAESAAEQFADAPRDLLRHHLDTLVRVGEAWQDPDGRYNRVEAAA